jgi:tripartite-type tricarboxylate transporter receptor subunit TctC
MAAADRSQLLLHPARTGNAKMHTRTVWRVVYAASTVGFLQITASASADEVAAFYQGKQISIVVGFPPGGGFDLYARLLARHIGRHIPGEPSTVIRNMPGAGSLVSVNYLYNRAPADGTLFGTFAGSMALAPIVGDKNALFDSRKLSWLGSMDQETSIIYIWATTRVKSAADILTNEITIGTSSSIGTSYAFPTAENSLLGTRFKIVTGYAGSSDVMIAIERGEVQGMSMSLSTLKTVRPQWLEKKQINIILQETTRRHPDLPDVPTVLDLAKTEDTRRMIDLIYGAQIMGRPFAAPPGVPLDRIRAVRQAFDATMKDTVFLAGAHDLRMEIDPVNAADIQRYIARMYEMPQDLAARAMEAQGRLRAK